MSKISPTTVLSELDQVVWVKLRKILR